MQNTWNEFAVRVNEVLRMLERDALGFVLMCGGAWSLILGWWFLLSASAGLFLRPVCGAWVHGPQQCSLCAPWAFAGPTRRLRTWCR